MTETVHNETGFYSGMASVILLYYILKIKWMQESVYCQDRMTI